MKDYKADLNPEQLAAVVSTANNVVVIAGAGTGKTKTMAARVCHLIEAGIPPERILAITFTRKAASELAGRISLYAGSDCGKRVNASTFHSWCSRILANDRQNAYTIIDPEDQKDMLAVIRGSRARDFPKAPELRNIYSYCRNSLMKLTEYLQKYLPDNVQYIEAMKEIYGDYEKSKRRQNLLDLDDVLAVIARNLENEQKAAAIAGAYDAILVDEMQDTNPLQWRLLEPMIGKTSLFCVGDDAQSIYGFRGSDYKFIHDFTTLVPQSEKLTLTQNYRSPNSFLGISNWLLQESPIRYDKRLWSAKDGDLPLLRVFPDQLEEAEFIAGKIKDDHERGIPYASNLVLFRSSSWRKALDAALTKRKIPAIYIGGTQFLQARHVRDIVSSIRILHNPSDEIAWLRYLQIFPGIGEESSSELIGRLSAFSGLDERIELVRSSGPRFMRPAAALSEICARCGEGIVRLINHISVILADEFLKLYRNEWERRKADIPILQALAEREDGIASFLENYALNPVVEMGRDARDPVSDCVKVSTIHSAKGLEADIVYIPALQPGHYPPSYAKSEEEIEEERRALYVALTRAKVELNLSKSMVSSYQRVPRGSTYFLAGMPPNLVQLDVRATEAPLTPQLDLEIDPTSFGIEF